MFVCIGFRHFFASEIVFQQPANPLAVVLESWGGGAWSEHKPDCTHCRTRPPRAARRTRAPRTGLAAGLTFLSLRGRLPHLRHRCHFSVIRIKDSPPVKLRSRGPRTFEELPPSELLIVAKYLEVRHKFQAGSDEHLRAILEWFDLKRLTTQVGTILLEIIEKRFAYADEYLRDHPE